MRVGIVFCSYGMPELLTESLTPWINARTAKLGGNEFVISAISVPFKEYKGKIQEDMETAERLNAYKASGWIDYAFSEPKWEEEKTVRNTALHLLLEEAKCDTIWLADGDELYQLVEIERIMAFIQANPFTVWFRGSLKNYIFDQNTFLKEPFNPPRGYRVNPKGYRLYGFRFDNEMIYTESNPANNPAEGKIARIVDHEELPCLTIPKSVAWTFHSTWLSNEKSRLKSEYLLTRWGSSFCSYLWDYQKNCLVFNPAYYERFGKALPELGWDSD